MKTTNSNSGFSQVQIYRKATAMVLGKMNQDLISPEEAQIMIEFLKSGLEKVENSQEALAFCVSVGEKYPHLFGLTNYLVAQNDEEIESIFSELVELFLQKGEMEIAADIMDKIIEAKDGSSRRILKQNLKKMYPEEFAVVIKTNKY